MKKVLLSTWVVYDNYGSLLQAYCLKEEIEKILNQRDGNTNRSAKVRLLNYQNSNKNQRKNHFSLVRKIWGRGLGEVLLRIRYKFLILIYRGKLVRRREKFAEFREKQLNLYPEELITSESSLRKLEKFDLYVAGGDQIWNPKLLGGGEYLLAWAPKDAVKISYAPSVCVNHLTKTELKKYQTLESFKALSVREFTNAVKQISELVHKEITEVADPVVLYGRKKLLGKCRKTDSGKYAVVYLLNGTKKRHDMCADFLRQSKLEAKIIPTTNPKNLFFELVLSRNVDWEVGPSEFINLIYNAEVLITDSFHGVILALLLHKKFIVLPRNEEKSEQDNRLINVLKKVGLDEHFGEVPKDIENIRLIDWKEVDKKIDDMQEKSLEYLIRAITEKNSD